MLTVTRDGYEAAGGSTPTRKEYEASVKALFFTRNSPGIVAISFVTNREGSRKTAFQVHIDGSDFEEVAREMMKANPAAAIRAFGAAMADFSPAADSSR